ncbi:PREDICTED: phospholipase A2 inhibitor and Ly6/PLAUR domain-containing protein-like [Gekko japonicus]|uniref:Phospholipase A2 inhibitor and Ly6/PLAUR domain-containing protein-like n=1 Tax=Gekko japonicus TaxID=146911 RepID=A0ABM1KP44_GEKJA|nr:PREDICTED: phospholipase A2 inhibitor and Ly6/PLAUR domain-containing protein-like [Gekko japonicus]
MGTCSPNTMPGFVLFCLLSALFTAGHSLICEVCKSKDITCSGNLQTCDDSEDICATLVAEYKIAGLYFRRTFKECLASSPICSFIPFSMTFRPSIAMRTSFNCCSTDGCNSGQSERTPSLPTPPHPGFCSAAFSPTECYGSGRDMT